VESRRFLVGGCVYRLSVHAYHAQAIVGLAAASMVARARGIDAPVFSDCLYRHTSNLPQGRALWLRDAMAERPAVKWAVSIDSDTWPTQPAHLLGCIELVTDDWAMGLVPVRQGGNSACNLRRVKPEVAQHMSGSGASWGWITVRDLEVFPPLELQEAQECAAGGFGLVVFNLDWFRRYWPNPEPEVVNIGSGEDIELCLSVRRRGGAIRVLLTPTEHREFAG
jgi:hypothetical protein